MNRQSTGVADAKIERLVAAVRRRAPLDAAEVLRNESDDTIAAVMRGLHPAMALRVVLRFPEERQSRLRQLAGQGIDDTWTLSREYPEGTVGRLMEPVYAVFPPDATVADAVARIRELVEVSAVTYAYVIDDAGRLLGLVVMRDLLLAGTGEKLSDIMLDAPFYFTAGTTLSDAMQAVVYRHYPIYPVCDEEKKLLGVVQGYMLFERQKFEISAQAGQMVGVDKEEHLATSWWRSLRLRHPWLQLNLFTAFIAAGVVSLFEDTISRVVVLAAFLPVLAGQSGNTGCQSLAVTLRAMTLGEFKPGLQWMALYKETLLGVWNGFLVGLVAGVAMYFYATSSGAPGPIFLSLVVLLAMTGACIASGIAGVIVPLTLRRLGADPVTASSIFLTTATDVVSMGLFLWLAKLLVLD
ncbi:MAG: magnesium transporter [Arenicellales bacterium]